MRHFKKMKVIYMMILVFLTLGTILNAQSVKDQKPKRQTIKVMTYNLKFASPTFKPAWSVIFLVDTRISMRYKANRLIITLWKGNVCFNNSRIDISFKQFWYSALVYLDQLVEILANSTYPYWG